MKNTVELALEDVCLNAGKELANTPIKKPEWIDVYMACVEFQSKYMDVRRHDPDNTEIFKTLKSELHEKMVKLDIAQYIKWD